MSNRSTAGATYPRQVLSGVKDKPLQKREFIRQFASKAGLPLTAAETAYNAFLTVTIQTIHSGREVQLTGFGRFYPITFRGGSPTRLATAGATQFDNTSPTRRARDSKQMRFTASVQSKRYLELTVEEAAAARIPGTRPVEGSTATG